VYFKRPDLGQIPNNVQYDTVLITTAVGRRRARSWVAAESKRPADRPTDRPTAWVGAQWFGVVAITWTHQLHDDDAQCLSDRWLAGSTCTRAGSDVPTAVHTSSRHVPSGRGTVARDRSTTVAKPSLARSTLTRARKSGV